MQLHHRRKKRKQFVLNDFSNDMIMYKIVTMPGSLSGSYQSLTGSNDVYRSTTVAGANLGVLDTFKKVLSITTVKEERKPVIMPAAKIR